MGHVTERIEVNQKADAGDDQQHHRRQRVDLKRKLDLERTRFDPGINRIAKDAVRRQLPENIKGQGERRAHGRRRQRPAVCLPSARPKNRLNHASQQRNQRNPAQQIVSGALGSASLYHLSSCISWGSRDWRWRNTDMMMARPITASAAATAMTKKTITWPSIGAEIAGKSDEGEIHRVEHQLDGHQDHDQITPDQYADHADGEDHRAENQIIIERHHGH